MEAIQYIVFVQVLLACCCAASTTTETARTATNPVTTTETNSPTPTTASSTTTLPSTTGTPSTRTTILTSKTITTTSTDGLTSTPAAASTSTSSTETTTVTPQTTSTIKTTSSTVEETSMSPQGTTQSNDPDSTTALSNPTTITITTQTAISTATEQFPSNYSPSTEVATMAPTTKTNLTADNMTSTSMPDLSTPYSTTGKSTGFAGTTEHVGVSTTTAGTTKQAAELTTTAGTTANTLYEDEEQVINLRKDIDALEKENSLFVYIIIGLAVALGVVLMTTVICCVYCSGRQGNASIDDGIDNDIKTSANLRATIQCLPRFQRSPSYVRTRRPFGSISNDVVHLFSRATRRFSGRDSRENQLNSQPRHTFTNKLAEEDNEETEKVSEEKDTTKSAELVELKEVTEVQTEVVNETVVDGGISRNQPAFASLKNGDTNSKLQKSQPCVVPIPTVPTVPIGEAIVAMDNGEVDKETDDNTKDTVSKTDQSAEAANSDKTIAVTLRSDIEVENVISCRVDDRAMSEVDLSDQNEIPLPPPLADNGQQSEQGVDVSVAN